MRLPTLLAPLCTLATVLVWRADPDRSARFRSDHAGVRRFSARIRLDVDAARRVCGDRRTPTATLLRDERALEQMRHVEDPARADGRGPLLQHEVRDLLDEDVTIESLASWVETWFEGVSVTPRVNVLEVRAPRETHLRLERALEGRRRTLFLPESCVLRIHPVADLLYGLTDFIPPQITQVSVEEDPQVPLFGKPADVEPGELYTIARLFEAIHGTIAGDYSLHERGKNLIVFAEPTVQDRVAGLLDDLRGP